MFRSRFYHTIDEKGRVSLPAKYREIISTSYNDQLIITNYDSCLLAYPYDEWVTLEEKFKQHSIMQPEVEICAQFFISGASECTVDKLGRILIPPTLREYAGLERNVVFVGMISQIQIWDKQRWEQKFLVAQEQQMLAIGRGLMGEPRLLILDEPSLGLSPLLVEEMFALIRRLNDDGLAVLLVEQNVGESRAVADRAYVLENGAVRFHGTPAELLANGDLKRAYLGL